MKHIHCNRIYKKHFYFYPLLVLLLSFNNAYAQCPSGCDVTITPSSSMTANLTINSSASTNQYCFNASTGDIVYTGSINLQSGGTLVICGGNTNTVYLNGSFIEGTNGVRNIIVNGNLVMDDSDGNAGITKATVTVNGTMRIIGKGSPTAVAFTGGSLIVNSGGKMILDAVNSNMAGASYTVDGTLELTGNLATSAASVFNNTGLMKISGNASFSGTYNNHGMWKIGQKLSLNASAGSDLTGGMFYCEDLEFNSATLTASAGGCSAFVVNNFSDINSAGLSATGDIGLLDLSNPGFIDDVNTTCQAGDAAPWSSGPYCGIRPLAAMSGGAGGCFGTLPVVWADFTCVMMSESEAKLDWATTEERNVLSFTVQRSIDGSIFEDLYQMAATGNSSNLKSYSYIDPTAYGNFYYYRIKQTDVNNYFSYSEIVMINNQSDQYSLQLYPNPANYESSVSIIVKGEQEGETNISIVDTRGTEMYSITNNTGKKDMELFIGNEFPLPKGIYVVVLKNNNGVATERLVVE